MKKLISVVLVLSCLFTCVVTARGESSESAESENYEMGTYSPFDVLMPAIPVTDAHFKRMADAGLTKEKIECIPGDANFDGKVNATDALFALVYGLKVMSYVDSLENVWTNPYGYSNNLFYRGFRRVGDLRIHFEIQYANYYIEKQTDPEYEFMTIKNRYFRMNSALMADVNLDDRCDATDALYILQYAVGKIDKFPRTGCEDTGRMFYVPWIGDWEPKMIYENSDRFYQKLIWPPEG